ncbi:MAG: hypothetical protein GTN75_10120 [Gemmatimonadetes bacterium]|nr:hypothetical protein [Gemmatimonadota bacterium]
MRSRGVTFHYVVERAEGEPVLAEAETDLVCVDSSGSPRKLPGSIEELLGAALEPQIA